MVITVIAALISNEQRNENYILARIYEPYENERYQIKKSQNIFMIPVPMKS